MRRANAVAMASNGRPRWRGSAFGLAVSSTVPLWSAEVTANGRDPASTRLELVDAATLKVAWPRRESHRLVDRRYPSGRSVLRIDHHPTAGYLVVAPGHGTHVVSVDGRSIQSALPDVPRWRWQRLLFAQVLPLAAALQGLELFHASAITFGRRAVGFVAASGTGKTSVAAHLVARGAELVTDDVMAVEPRGDDVRVHPGAGNFAVYASELRGMTPAGRARLGPPLGLSGKTYLARRPPSRPLPLGAAYYLERHGGVERFSIEASPGDPRLLLSSAFMWYLDTPEHLRNHLDACARIAAAVPLFTVQVPAGVHAAEVAERVEAHSSSVLS